jgi:hypothetical protein
MNKKTTLRFNAKRNRSKVQTSNNKNHLQAKPKKTVNATQKKRPTK